MDKNSYHAELDIYSDTSDSDLANGFRQDMITINILNPQTKQEIYSVTISNMHSDDNIDCEDGRYSLTYLVKRE